MGIANDLAALDATAQAELVRRGEASAAEMVDAAIEAAERVNPQINAIIHPRYEAAAAEAATVDTASASGGPFAGVPIVIKDLGCVMKDEPHHFGNRALKAIDYRSPVDSSLYRRFRAAGFVAIGRTNAPEMGSTITTEPLAYGPSRNPWNLDHSTGGSSGGSAAAVAAGIVAVGHANDGGGSIRVPASECGLVGPEAEQRPGQPGAVDRRGVGRRHDRRLRHAQRARHGCRARRDLRLRTGRPVHRSALRSPARRRGRRRSRSAAHRRARSLARRAVASRLRGSGCGRRQAARRRSVTTSTTSSPAALHDPGFQDRFVTVVSACTAARSARARGHPRPTARRWRSRARQRVLRRARPLGVGGRLPAHPHRSAACGAGRCCRGGTPPTAAPVTICC